MTTETIRRCYNCATENGVLSRGLIGALFCEQCMRALFADGFVDDEVSTTNRIVRCSPTVAVNR